MGALLDQILLQALVRAIKSEIEHRVPVEDGRDVRVQRADARHEPLYFGLNRTGRAALGRALTTARRVPFLYRDHLVLGQAGDLLGRKNTILDCAVERGRDAVPAPESRWRLRYNDGRDGARGKIGRGHSEKRQDGEDDHRSCF